MILNKSTASITVLLSGAPASIGPTCWASYGQPGNQPTGGGSGDSNVLVLTSTAQTLVPANSNGSTEVKNLILYNADTASVTPTINLHIGSTDYPVWSGTLDIGDTLTYKGGTFTTTDSAGRSKGASSTGNIASTSATAFAVGPSGTTNPSLVVDASTASAVTGVKVKSAASGAGVAVSVISSAGAEALTMDAKGTGTIGIGTVSTGAITLGAATTISGNLTLSTKNLVTDTVTGTKIGTATTQKLGFYNATPVVQPGVSVDATGFVAGSGTASKSDSVWAGASGATAYTVGGLVTALKALGLIAV